MSLKMIGAYKSHMYIHNLFGCIHAAVIFLEIMNKMYIRPIIKQMDCFGVVGQHTSC